MQYRVPKKPRMALLLVAGLAAAGCSLLIMASLGIAIPALLWAVALLFFAVAAYLMTRFVLFDTAYRLGEDYGDFSVSFYLLTKKESRFFEKVEFTGEEELLLLDKKGKKALKNREKRFDLTSNLVPDKRYALLFTEGDKKVYAILEMNQAFQVALSHKIALAKRFYETCN